MKNKKRERNPLSVSPSDFPYRRDDPYWPESKRMAMEDRHRSDWNRQDRFHDFDHRDRGRYQDHSLDRLPNGLFVLSPSKGYGLFQHRCFLESIASCFFLIFLMEKFVSTKQAVGEYNAPPFWKILV